MNEVLRVFLLVSTLFCFIAVPVIGECENEKPEPEPQPEPAPVFINMYVREEPPEGELDTLPPPDDPFPSNHTLAPFFNSDGFNHVVMNVNVLLSLLMCEGTIVDPNNAFETLISRNMPVVFTPVNPSLNTNDALIVHITDGGVVITPADSFDPVTLASICNSNDGRYFEFFL